VTAVLGSCSDGLFACTDELRVRFDAHSAEIVVGQQLTPTARLGTCGGRKWSDAELVLTSYDTSVVRVLPGDSVLVGVAPGATAVDVSEKSGFTIGLIAVRVHPLIAVVAPTSAP
jgi:hypothetical protein